MVSRKQANLSSSGRKWTSTDERSEREQAPVLVTGDCGRLGKRLVRMLHRERAVVGIDARPFADCPKDVEHFTFDLRRKKTRDVFRSREFSAVVHLGIMHDPRKNSSEHHAWNVTAFQKILDYVAQYEVTKLIVLSGAAVYGPRSDNPQFLTEEAPLLGGARFSDIRDLIEVDMLAQSFFWKHPQTETVVLRPVHILGDVRNASSNYLRLARIPTLLGFDPMMQVVHQDDVVRAIQSALVPGKRGIFNVAGCDPLPLSSLISLTGRPRIPVPHPLAEVLARRLWALGVTSFPAPELDFIRYVCMVDDRKARETLGFVPRYGIRETVDAVFENE
jgi:UDP-glucose 4-epimerase